MTCIDIKMINLFYKMVNLFYKSVAYIFYIKLLVCKH